MRLKITGSTKQKNRFLTHIEYIEGMEFYSEGKGGQLGDLGSVGETQVLEVDRNGNLFLDRELKLGEYEYLIDMDRRHEIGKNHTAQHLVSAYLKEKYDLDTVGFRMGEEYSTVDFPSLEIDEVKIRDLEAAMNRMITENLDVEILSYTREEAAQIESLRKSISDKVVGNVKVVKIGNFDLNACGGFHVKQTKDIGLFKVVNYEKTKKTLTRIYYKAGNRCYEDYYKKHEIIKKARTQLSSTVEEVNDKIDYLLEDSKSKTKELNGLYHDYSELLCEKLKVNAEIVGENKIIIYKKNDAVTKFFSKFIDGEKYSLIYGEEGNFTVMSRAINCSELKSNLEKLGYIVKGGGNSTRVNLRIDTNIEKIVDIFLKLL
ncbi:MULTISPECIES: alanyl-tRNA editing protein [Psychrilyobacter]|nr:MULTISPECIES: alanyl-tRNA editing protein [Psychrilyobacter]MCS5422242.1 alanyl-tRNA editing protein [Psychrilyobacter sp. S5]NDI78756.1 alanyl-tRNA editing protein [Psychrilyobacter piezotolerans]